MTSKQKIIVIFLLISAVVSYSKVYALNDNFSNTSKFTNEKFIKGTTEIKNEISKIGLTKNSPNNNQNSSQNKNTFDLKSKASELGISEENLSKLIVTADKSSDDSLQTDAMSSSVLNGTFNAEGFGFSVAKAGDLNGDGYDDIIVGAPYNNSSGNPTGKAYIFFGGSVMDDIADLVFTGTSTNGYFGCSVAGAGDVNGDGYSDLLIGACYAGTGGKAYLYYGRAAMNNVEDLTFTGAVSNSGLGYSVSTAGDVNGDGYSDFIIGSPHDNHGKAFIYLGGNSPDNVADFTLSGSGGEELGLSVSQAGDVNGDGYSDVIVGAPYYSSQTGRTLIYFGGRTMDNSADVTLTGESTSDNFGFSVSGIGDMNGDGYEDVLVSAPFNDAVATDAGRAYVFFGGAIMNTTPDLVMSGKSANEFFGYCVGFAGDINTDGYADVIIGSPGSSAVSPQGGAAYSYFGGINPDNIPDVIYSCPSNSYAFGTAVCSAGDVNADGTSDIIVSVPYAYTGTVPGSIYLYKNKLIGSDIADLKFTGSASNDYLGIDIANAGDVNGDGYSDLIIGSSGYSGGRGRASLYFGGPNLDNVADVNFIGSTSTEAFGFAVSSAGDVNGDGFSNVIIGATSHNNNTGRAYICFGGSVVDTTKDIILTGQSAGDHFGNRVSTAGDVNADGFSDVIVAAPNTDDPAVDAGKVYLYYGGRSMDNIVDASFRGIYANDNFGYSLSTAGDLNGDGYADLIIGCPYNTTGKAYMYYGSSIIDTTRDLTFSGTSNLDYFGYSVSGGMDINKDGYSDIIIGAPLNDDGGSYSGKVYGYYGGTTMDNITDFSLTGTTGQYIGVSVCNARDVNKDGYDDIITGTASTTSKAFVYLGSAYINTLDPIIMSSSIISEQFGYIVSSAGDYNGDGYSDVMVGAPTYSSSKGEVYLYLSTAPPGNPNMLYAKDVPNDQGGYLHLKFSKSGYDFRGLNRITAYYIEKSRAPGLNGFVWESEASIPATNNSDYQYTAPTWSDTSSGNNNRVFYRVTAFTNVNGEYFRSNVVSGQSIDNLSPATPTGLAAAPTSTKINLSWTANTEADMKDYLVYRNGVNISTASSISFSDTTALADSVYIYKIAARDIHGNISPLSTADTASLESITTINVTVIPEGLLNTGTNQLRLRDTIKAKLWDLTGSVIVDSATAVIDSITFIASFTFKNAPSGDYYLAINHRNSIETWSKTGGENYTRGTTTTYDFTSAISQAYGNNLKLKGGRYCLYSGDVNGSGVINSTDRTLIRSNVGQTGYIRFDLDGNGVVNSADRTIVRNNTGIARQRP